MTPLDGACRELAELAKAQGLYAVSLFVRADGRVEVRGEQPPCTPWVVRASVHPLSESHLPSAALAERSGR